MIYRIDKQHFISHAIDYFTNEELSNMKYLLTSLKLSNGGIVKKQVERWVEIMPIADVAELDWFNDREAYEKAYMDMLKNRLPRVDDISITSTIHSNLIKPLLNHEDRMLVCDESENYILDIFCEFVKEKFKIEIINLNKLFSEGEHEPIKYDHDRLKRLSKQILEEAEEDAINALSRTERGRAKLLLKMTTYQKKDQLKSLGINPKKHSEKEYDQLLNDLWVHSK